MNRLQIIFLLQLCLFFSIFQGQIFPRRRQRKHGTAVRSLSDPEEKLTSYPPLSSSNEVVVKIGDMSLHRGHTYTMFRLDTKKDKKWSDFREFFFPWFMEMKDTYGRTANKYTEFVSKKGGSGRVEFVRSKEELAGMSQNRDILMKYYDMLFDKMKRVFVEFLEGEVTEDDIAIRLIDSFCIYRARGAGHHYYHTHYAENEVNWVAVWYLAVPEAGTAGREFTPETANRLWTADFMHRKEMAILAEQGDVLIHPSWVSHGTEEIPWKGTRAVFATNVEITFRRKENLYSKLTKKPFTVKEKAQKLQPFPLFYSYFDSPPHQLLRQEYLNKFQRELAREEGAKGEDKLGSKLRNEDAGRRREKRVRKMRAGTSYKTPGMEITENEEVKDWLFSSAAQAISQQNRELLQEREKTSKHFSHAFGECTFPTSETEVSKLFLPAVYAQKFHSSGTAIRPMKETGISNYQNVNRTWFQEPEGWSLFYFLKECGTHGANLALNGLNAKQTPSEVGTVRQSFDTILNTALIPTQMNIEGGQALLLPSNVIQRLSLQIVSPCKFIVFHFQMEKQNYQCHLI